MRTVKDLSRIMSIDGADEVRAHLIMLHDIRLRVLLLEGVDDASSPTGLSMGDSRPRSKWEHQAVGTFRSCFA